jgi:hypothetical protein
VAVLRRGQECEGGLGDRAQRGKAASAFAQCFDAAQNSQK